MSQQPRLQLQHANLLFLVFSTGHLFRTYFKRVPIRANFTLRGSSRSRLRRPTISSLSSSRRVKLYLPSIHPIPRCIISFTPFPLRLSQTVSIELNLRWLEYRAVHRDSGFPNYLFEIQIAQRWEFRLYKSSLTSSYLPPSPFLRETLLQASLRWCFARRKAPTDT